MAGIRVAAGGFMTEIREQVQRFVRSYTSLPPLVHLLSQVHSSTAWVPL
ncbi:MAG UNVERIFIED_CONTAM: hypothetical protein LVR18_35820 [Planctomycetaceae bacterium]